MRELALRKQQQEGELTPEQQSRSGAVATEEPDLAEPGKLAL